MQHSAKTVRPHSGTKTVRSHSGAARSLGVLLLRTQTLHSRACLSVYCKRQKPLRLTARPLSGGLLQRDSNDLSVRAQKTCQIVHIVALLYFFREESGDDCGTPHGVRALPYYLTQGGADRPLCCYVLNDYDGRGTLCVDEERCAWRSLPLSPPPSPPPRPPPPSLSGRERGREGVWEGGRLSVGESEKERERKRGQD